MNEIATANISKVQAEHILSVIKSNKGYVDVPKTNSYVNLVNGVTIRKLHPKFRKGNKSKAFQIKGPIAAMRKVSNLLQGSKGDKMVSITMKVTRK